MTAKIPAADRQYAIVTTDAGRFVREDSPKICFGPATNAQCFELITKWFAQLDREGKPAPYMIRPVYMNRV